FPPIHFFFSIIPPPPTSTLFPYTTLFRSRLARRAPPAPGPRMMPHTQWPPAHTPIGTGTAARRTVRPASARAPAPPTARTRPTRSEERRVGKEWRSRGTQEHDNKNGGILA